MNKTIISVIALIVIVVGGYFVFKNPQASTPTQVPAPTGTPAQQSFPSAENNAGQTQPPTSTNPEEQAPAGVSQIQPPAATNVKPAPTVKTPSGDSQNQAKETIVYYTNSGYSPRELTINRGDTVIFKNQSSNSMWTASDIHPSHTLYDGTSLSQHCANLTATTFDECGSAQPGQEWSFIFSKAGTWGYHNHVNPGYTGEIIVK